MEEAYKLKDEFEKLKSQFYIFYEFSQAMRTTLRLDEISYIILTGFTAHQGLGFNRALLFLVDNKNERIDGYMGIGHIDAGEANKIWERIEEKKMDLYDLIEVWRKIKEDKITPKFMEFTRSLSFTLNEKGGIIAEALFEKNPLHIKEEKSNIF